MSTMRGLRMKFRRRARKGGGIAYLVKRHRLWEPDRRARFIAKFFGPTAAALDCMSRPFTIRPRQGGVS